ncbi:ribonuclease P protein subunit p25-like protein [Varroa jacobsoni]|uniref:DNA/RNA-binding protein Alba-like domain-containing protein n=1 Tax=Varroa destructor TaxID=109461 RepID=A0A7M7IXZ6_VARDE|nr:ribonuclease P protein subunit p25-like protein [Varroa destructor]XP_022644125.1 ribonuclease P protein subunit p25-like protein [Varroa destructor]XP_022644126.1 ribonuclease P protein subunit p25-like protein [Varroa destructor]XP_022644127.1 ribonuclease P protein subunit p25-like protein [Varroa destructor]XP_022694303.1 ribonuclease P protein subunit p25-like protein [Varroa jacobsoni]XP_022694304.1 ribonuclease P protein subunit p25-like protein [Varroa jacobsoni]XP_022694305.1 ribo
METYNRGEIVDVDVGLPFPVDLVDKNVPQLNVQAGSKIRNLLNFALPTIKNESQLIIVGSGLAISKVITVAEMLKRKERGLDQWNKIGYKKILEYWEPQEEGMFRLQVTREIPVMHILLSKTPLDPTLSGVQKVEVKGVKYQKQQRNRRSKQGKARKMEEKTWHGASDTAARNERSEGSQCRTDLNACVQGEEIGPNEVQNAEPKSTYIAE